MNYIDLRKQAVKKTDVTLQERIKRAREQAAKLLNKQQSTMAEPEVFWSCDNGFKVKNKYANKALTLFNYKADIE